MSNLVTANIAFNSEANYRVETGLGSSDNVIRIVGQSPGKNTIHIGQNDRVSMNGIVNIANVLTVTSNLYSLGYITSAQWPIIPSLTFGGANTGMTYTIREANAVQTGRLVNFQLRIVLTGKGTSTGDAVIVLPGMPDSPLMTTSGRIGYWAGFAANAAPYGCYIFTGAANTINVQMRSHATGAGTTPMTHVHWSNTSDMLIEGSYITGL